MAIKRDTYTMDECIIELLKVLSKKTRIPKSRLVVEAIEDLFKKYHIA